MRLLTLSKIAVIGAGSHTRSSINLLLNYFNVQDIVIYDDSFIKGKNEKISTIPLIGNISKIKENEGIFLSIGNNNKRREYFLKFKHQLIRSVYHASSLQEDGSKFGLANQVFAHSYINSNVTIGNDNIINTGAIIEHDVKIGNHNHISIGARICGKVVIGDMCLVGAGAVILDKLSICDNVVIGAGSVVVKNIEESGTYAGIPAKKIK